MEPKIRVFQQPARGANCADAGGKGSKGHRGCSRLGACERARPRPLLERAVRAAGKRPGLLALYAFNAELDRIVDATASRWRDRFACNGGATQSSFAAPGAKTGNPSPMRCSTAIAGHDLPKDAMIAMVDARMPVMFGEPPPDDRRSRPRFARRRARSSNSACAILGDRSEIAREASGHAGVAYGLTDMLAKLPFGRRVPQAVLAFVLCRKPRRRFCRRRARRDDAQASRLPPPISGASPRAIFSSSARRRPELDAAAWPAFLPLTLIKPHLRAMAAPDFDPLRPSSPSIRCGGSGESGGRRGGVHFRDADMVSTQPKSCKRFYTTAAAPSAARTISQWSLTDGP